MTIFSYIAIDEKGKTIRGQMVSESKSAVIAKLQSMGRLPVRAVPSTTSHLVKLLRYDLGKTDLSRRELVELTRELATMLLAGQDLDRSLSFIEKSTSDKRVRLVSEAIRDAVRDGATLEVALRRHPKSFPRLYCGLVRCGELTGTLAQTLEQLGTTLESEQALTATVLSSLIGPALLVLASVGSVILLLTTVLPAFVPLFEQAGTVLPAPTKLLIGLGTAVSEWGIVAAAGLLVLGLASLVAIQRPATRLLVDRSLLRLPILGPLLREVMANRFARTLGTLLTNGEPLLASLYTAGDVLRNQACRNAVAQARVEAESGAGIARAISSSGVFPVRLGSLLLLGQETAQLGPMALRAADIHEAQARRTLQRLTALLVPLTTVIMGGIVAWIVSALLLAMIGLNELAG